MENFYAILMLILAAVLLLFAVLIGLCGINLVKRGLFDDPENKKIYSKKFGVLLAVISLVPFLSGIFSYLNLNIISLVILVVGSFVGMYFMNKTIKTIDK